MDRVGIGGLQLGIGGGHWGLGDVSRDREGGINIRGWRGSVLEVGLMTKILKGF